MQEIGERIKEIRKSSNLTKKRVWGYVICRRENNLQL